MSYKYLLERNEITKKTFSIIFMLMQSNAFISMFLYMKIVPSGFEKSDDKNNC